MVNPGAFLGSRKEFLAAQVDLYSAAVNENHISDTVADIQRRYFKRYPVSLPHNEEPSAEWLSQVDDNSPDKELAPPDDTTLDAEAYRVAKAAYDEHVKIITFRKGQIARRLSYQYTKAHNPPKHVEAGSDDPMAVLMAKLAGIPIKKPRLRPAHVFWAQKHRQFVDTLFEERVKEGNVPTSKRAALRMNICKECFNELELDEKKDYQSQATEEHRVAVEKIESTLNSPASTDPADRQKILEGLPNFIQPILDLVTEYSGWKATLIVGGPEPADQGRLNIMSFHSGETKGPIKMNFGRSERRAYKDFVTPIFGNFLKKCYTVEECRAAAIPDPNSASLADVLRLGGGEFTVDSAEGAIVRVARTPSGGSVPNTSESTSHVQSQPATYEIPAKIGPPIHARRKDTTVVPPTTHPSAVEAGIRPSNQRLSHLITSPLASVEPSSTSAPPSPCPSLALTPRGSPVLSSRELRRNDLPPPTQEIMQNIRASSLPCSQQRSSLDSTTRRASNPLPSSMSFSQQYDSPGSIIQASELHSSSLTRSSLTAINTTTCRVQDPQSLITKPVRFSSLPLQQSHEHIVSIVRASEPPTSPVGRLLHSTSYESLPDLPTRITPPSTTAAREIFVDPSSTAMPLGSKKRRRANQEPDQSMTQELNNNQQKRKRIALNVDAGGSCAETEVSPQHGMSAAPLTPEEIAGAPDWFLDAYQMLMSNDFGPAWMQLVRLWAQFEKMESFTEVDKLGTKGRPGCVRDWIARARSTTYRPDVGPLGTFAKSFNTWWRGIQPAWRIERGAKLQRSVSGDIEELRRPGKNGLLSVLAALFFWGHNIVKGSGRAISSHPWKAAVDDVQWVLQNLTK